MLFSWKTFDCLSNELLVAKPDAYGFSRETLSVIHCYLYKRKQRVKVNGLFRDWKDIDQDVLQGSIIGTLLLNIYKTVTGARDPLVIGWIRPSRLLGLSNCENNSVVISLFILL